MASSQSIDMDMCTDTDHTDHSDQMSTPTPTPKAGKNKTFAFAVGSSPTTMFTYTQTGKLAGKSFKNTSASAININGKKRKTAGSPSPSKLQKLPEKPDTDTEDEDLNTTYKAAKKALWKILGGVNPEAKMEVRQAMYHLDKALNQTTTENPLQTQLQQLNAKMDTLLRKQDLTAATTEKVAQKAAQKAADMTQNQAVTAATIARPATAAKKPEPSIQKTWAQKAAATGSENAAWTTVTAKAAKPKPKPNAESEYRERQLLLTPKTAVTSINSIAYRNAINKALKEAKINNVLVSTVTMSRTGNSIVVTAAEGNTAEDLLQHKAIWGAQLNLIQIRKNNKWHKMVLHKLPTAVFNTEEGLEMLQEEVELFNKGLKLVTKPVWLSTAENRQNKMHSSAIIAFATQEELQNALRTRVVVAGTTVRTAAYTDNKPYDQCLKCQGFGHTYQKCINASRCQICAGNHSTRSHTCNICKKGQELCAHTVIKCSNCKESHKADSKDCAVYKALKPYSSGPDPLAMDENV